MMIQNNVFLTNTLILLCLGLRNPKNPIKKTVHCYYFKQIIAYYNKVMHFVVLINYKSTVIITNSFTTLHNVQIAILLLLYYIIRRSKVVNTWEPSRNSSQYEFILIFFTELKISYLSFFLIVQNLTIYLKTTYTWISGRSHPTSVMVG